VSGLRGGSRFSPVRQGDVKNDNMERESNNLDVFVISMVTTTGVNYVHVDVQPVFLLHHRYFQ
jgi:hypothetical protein